MNARDYALFELDRRDLPNWSANQMRPKDRSAPADPRDYALAEQITTGVVQNLLLLQHLISHYAGRPLKKIDPLVQKILAVGLYQLRFLTRIPPSAAVDQAVTQSKHFGRTAAAGFVNAILRNALRQPNPPLPDESNPQAYAEIVLSHPPELFHRLLSLTSDPARALSICRHDNQQPPTIVRLLPGADASQLTTEGITITPHDHPGMYVIDGAKQSTLASFAARGLAQVQDPTAAKVIDFCDVHPGQTILDRCAGLGTKTLQLLTRVGPAGKILAMDPSVPRCKGLAKLLSHRNITNVHIEPFGYLKDIKSPLPPHFDRVLVDAPCSNSGVLPRRPEARYAQDDHSLASLRKLQLTILADTAPRVSPDGGLLIYSTCSIWPDENTGVVSTFLSNHQNFTLLSEHPTLPSFDVPPTSYHDGGYVAVLRRAPG